MHNVNHILLVHLFLPVVAQFYVFLFETLENHPFLLGCFSLQLILQQLRYFSGILFLEVVVLFQYCNYFVSKVILVFLYGQFVSIEKTVIVLCIG